MLNSAEGWHIYTKGASEIVLAQCTHMLGPNGVKTELSASKKVEIESSIIKTYADDAGSSAFGGEAGRSVAELRLRLGTWLDAKAPAPRERWHDPRPARPDPAKVPPVAALPAPTTR
jgi:hypothetical protein